MRMMNKIGIGIMAAVGTAAAVGAGSKIVDNHRRKWFDNGYKSGHFAGFIDGAKSMVSIAEETEPSLRRSIRTARLSVRSMKSSARSLRSFRRTTTIFVRITTTTDRL